MGGSVGMATRVALERRRRLFNFIFGRRLRRRARRLTPRGLTHPKLFSAEVALFKFLVARGAERRMLPIRPFLVRFTVCCQTEITVATSDPSTIHARSLEHIRSAVCHDLHLDVFGPSRRGRRRRGTRSLIFFWYGCRSCPRPRHGRSCPRPRSSSRSFPRPPCFLSSFLVCFRTSGDHRESWGAERQG